MAEDHDMTNCKRAMADLEPGVRLHYVVTGEGKPVVVLLHGFPRTWWEWRHVIPALANAGFRSVVASSSSESTGWIP